VTGRHFDRRRVVKSAALALAPAVALACPLARLGATTGSVAPPAGLFTLERVLTRGLAGGAVLTVTRRWRIGFAPRAGGLQVDGAQLFAAVAAPPVLAPLARLEESRSTAAMFPMALGPDGRIVDGRRDPDGTQLAAAIEAARLLLSRPGGDPARFQHAQGFLRELANMSADMVSRLPADLFFPITTPMAETRDLALPEGATGSIAVELSASADPQTGLLRVSERRVTTRIGSSARVAAERWSLAPI
jgi:hypothetical protein